MKQIHTFSIAAAVALLSTAPALAQSNGIAVDGQGRPETPAVNDQGGPAPTAPSAPAQVTTFSEEVMAPPTSITPRFRPWTFFQTVEPNVATTSTDESSATGQDAPAQNPVTRYRSEFNQPLIGVYR